MTTNHFSTMITVFKIKNYEYNHKFLFDEPILFFYNTAMDQKQPIDVFFFCGQVETINANNLKIILKQQLFTFFHVR